jgi:hypothetical protein
MALNKPTTLQDICTSLETSRKLTEAGFPQEGGIAYWTKTKYGNWILLPYDVKREITIYTPGIVSFEEYKFYRAFTFNELWELLPKGIKYSGLIYRINIYTHCGGDNMFYGIDKNDKILMEETNTEYENALGYIWSLSNIPQEAAAELALWCRKEGHL